MKNLDITQYLELAACAKTIIVFLVCHVIVAIAIYRSAKQRVNTNGAVLRFFTPVVWAFIGFVSGIYALALYWVMHYSTLAKDEN